MAYSGIDKVHMTIKGQWWQLTWNHNTTPPMPLGCIPSRWDQTYFRLEKWDGHKP